MSTNLDKTALVIGASSESRYAIETAKKRGYQVVAFDGNPDAPGLSWADKGIVTDIRDAKNILEHLNSAAVPTPAFVLPVPIGRYLTSTGSVNDALGLKGISHKAANLCTDKYEFHCTLADAGLRNGCCMLIPAGDSADILSTDNIPLPFILKPRFGSGSRGVYLVENVEQREALKLELFPTDEDFIAETVFEGTEYGVDGCIFDGQLEIFLIRKKLITPPPYRQCVGYLSVDCRIYDTFYAKTTEYLSKVANALGMNHCLFHCDFMCDNTLNINLIEISARPSGHNLHNMFTPMVTGFSMIDRYIDYMEGLVPAAINNHITGSPMLIGYFDIECVQVVSVPTRLELENSFADDLLHYECNISVGDKLDTIENGHQLMSRGFYILKGSDEADLLRKKQELLSHFGVLWTRS